MRGDFKTTKSYKYDPFVFAPTYMNIVWTLIYYEEVNIYYA